MAQGPVTGLGVVPIRTGLPRASAHPHSDSSNTVTPYAVAFREIPAASVWANESPTTRTRRVGAGVDRPVLTDQTAPPSDVVSTLPPLPTATQELMVAEATPSRVSCVGVIAGAQVAPPSPV